MSALGRDRTILLSTTSLPTWAAAAARSPCWMMVRVQFKARPTHCSKAPLGRVFEITVDSVGAERLEAEHEIVSRSITPAGVALRGVAANGLPDGAAAVREPTLEEGYLAFMAARGRTEAAPGRPRASGRRLSAIARPPRL